MTPRWINAILVGPATALLARVTLTYPFWWSGVAKLMDYQAAVAEVAGLGVPQPHFTAALTIAVQLLGSAAIFLGRFVWVGAGALGVFTLAATLLAHAFWRAPASEAAHQLATFLEHLGLIGGLMLAAVLSERDSHR